MNDYTDYIAEQEAIARRRKLLEAMQAQNLQAPIVGNTGLGQALAKVATAYVQNRKADSLDERAQKNSQASQADLASQLKDYLSTVQGTKGTNISEGPPTEATFNTGDNAILGVPDQFVGGTPADPKAAVLKAMASQHPEMKAIGASGYKELLPQVKEIDGQLVQFNGMGTAPPKVLGSYRKPQVVDKQLVDINGQTPTSIFDGREKFGAVGKVAEGPSGPVFGQTEQGTGRVHFAPAGVNVNTNMTQEKSLDKAMGEKLLPVLEGAVKTASAAQNQLASANRIIDLVQDPQVITGFAANQVTGLTSLAAKFGLVGPEALSKTQQLVGEMAKQTLANVHLLPGAITEKERPFLEQAAAGQVNWDAGSIKRLAELSAATAHNTFMSAHEQYYSASQQLPQARSFYPFPKVSYKLPDNVVPESENSPRVTVRGNAVSGSQGAGEPSLSFEDAMRKARGGR